MGCRVPRGFAGAAVKRLCGRAGSASSRSIPDNHRARQDGGDQPPKNLTKTVRLSVAIDDARAPCGRFAFVTVFDDPRRKPLGDSESLSPGSNPGPATCKTAVEEDKTKWPG